MAKHMKNWFATLMFATVVPVAVAAPVMVSCKFDRTKRGGRDPQMDALIDSVTFRGVDFVIDGDPATVIDPPSTDRDFREAKLKDSTKELRLTWRPNAEPRERWPEVALDVNKFSGQGVLVFSAHPHAGKSMLEVVSIIRGECVFHKKKF
jgi:hypothetical protein